MVSYAAFVRRLATARLVRALVAVNVVLTLSVGIAVVYLHAGAHPVSVNTAVQRFRAVRPAGQPTSAAVAGTVPEQESTTTPTSPAPTANNAPSPVSSDASVSPSAGALPPEGVYVYD